MIENMQLIKNATIVNEGRTFVGSVLIDGEQIKSVFEGDEQVVLPEGAVEIEATGLLLLPGVIDDRGSPKPSL